MSMSDVVNALRAAGHGTFLLRINFDGHYKGYANREVTISGYPFEGKILNNFIVGQSFDFNSFQYNQQSISISLQNDERLQDLEKRQKLDGLECIVYIWAPGLDWDDIKDDGRLFTGRLRKKGHSKTSYEITVTDLISEQLREIAAPLVADGGFTHTTDEDISKRYPIPFGNPSRRFQLPNILTNTNWCVNHRKIATVDGDFGTGGSDLIIADSDGSVTETDYTYQADIDSGGETIYLLNFSVAPNAPVQAYVYGYEDGAGRYSGTAGTTIEHPCQILHYLIDQYTEIAEANIDRASFHMTENYFPVAKNDTVILSAVNGHQLSTKILSIFCAALLQVRGKVGLMAIDFDGLSPVGKLFTEIDAIGQVKVTETPVSIMANDIDMLYDHTIQSDFNDFQVAASRDKTNSTECNSSVAFYKETRKLVLTNYDTADLDTINAALDRQVKWRAFRHNLISGLFFHHSLHAVNEGQCVEVTCEEGPSLDGTGWTDEKFILIQKKYTATGIQAILWRINTD